MDHGDGSNSSLFCIPASHTDEQDDEGQLLTHTSFMGAGPLKTAQGYSLDGEDAAIYSDAEGVDHFSPKREGSDKTLKKKAAQSQAPQSDETIKSLLQVNNIHVDILASIGVDVCREYRLFKVENMLSRLAAGTTKCSICGICCYNTQKLKNHIKSKHLKKSSHQCTVCSKYFGDSQSVKVHRKKHAKGGYTHKCRQCHKKYPN